MNGHWALGIGQWAMGIGHWAMGFLKRGKGEAVRSWGFTPLPSSRETLSRGWLPKWSIRREREKGKELLPMPHAQCPMPHAPCPMPHAPCPMPNAPCPMPNAPCPMPHAQCPMPKCFIFYSQYLLINGQLMLSSRFDDLLPNRAQNRHRSTR